MLVRLTLINFTNHSIQILRYWVEKETIYRDDSASSLETWRFIKSTLFLGIYDSFFNVVYLGNHTIKKFHYSLIL